MIRDALADLDRRQFDLPAHQLDPVRDGLLEALTLQPYNEALAEAFFRRAVLQLEQPAVGLPDPYFTVLQADLVGASSA